MGCSSACSLNLELSAVDKEGTKQKKKKKKPFESIMPVSIILSFSTRVTESQMLRLGELWVKNSVLIYTQWALWQGCYLIVKTNLSISNPQNT